MCGITGFIETGGFSEEGAKESLARMALAVSHRGPDDAGVWLDAPRGVALAHRRLAIVDLSPAGHQPMTSASGRYVTLFNGEIYNHEELRAHVRPAPAWRGHSDTESLLAGFEAFGLEETLKRSVGMFAVAVWDRETARLTLARDRLGEKPLYYGKQGRTLLFGSELKALRAHPAFSGTIDQGALSSFLKHGYIPAPLSIYEGIFKLPPGTSVTFDVASGTTLPEPLPYWSLTQVAAGGSSFAGSDDDALDELERLLSVAVRGQLMSDVPLGAFLSGGVDSSTIVALMQSLGGAPVKTFTIGFSENEFDESAAAREVANHLGTEHAELVVTPAEAQAVIPRLPTIYDEPFGDSSAIPTWLLAGLARTQVTVALSGDGGDELFAGYSRYARTSRLWSCAAALSPTVRRAASLGMSAIPASALQRVMVELQVGGFPHLFSDRVRGFRTAFSASDVAALYDVRISNWPDPAAVLKSGATPTPSWAAKAELARTHPTERMMAFDTRSYLPDDVLVKVDRAAMSHSLETRVPLLDHRVVEFAWSLPHDLRVRAGEQKWLLKQLLYRHVPRALVDRPKQGFGVPISAWLRGPLKGWADELLSVQALELEGQFRAEPLRELWQQHLSGKADWQHRLWPVLMYQQWSRANS